MNNGINIQPAFYMIVLSSLLAMASVISSNSPYISVAYATSDQTAANGPELTENQSAGVTNSNPSQDQLSTKGNLTRADLDPILNNLFTARESLLHNNLVSSLDALNNAGKELFKLNLTLTEADGDGAGIQLSPLSKQIEYARVMVLNDNTTAAVRSLNAADTAFIIIAQELPQ
jgi:hypothetical protein